MRKHIQTNQNHSAKQQITNHPKTKYSAKYVETKQKCKGKSKSDSATSTNKDLKVKSSDKVKTNKKFVNKENKSVKSHDKVKQNKPLKVKVIPQNLKVKSKVKHDTKTKTRSSKLNQNIGPDKDNVISLNPIVDLDKNSVMVDIFEISFKSLIDTGASISCMTLRTVRRLGFTIQDLDPPVSSTVVGVGGEKHNSIGAITFPVMINSVIYNVRFHVFESFFHPVILGFDFLDANGAVFNAKNKTLKIDLPDAKRSFLLDTDNKVAMVAERSVIPPHSGMNIIVKCPQLSNSANNILLEPLPTLPKQNIAGAKCLVDMSQTNKAYMQVMNLGNKPVTLSANTPVASVCQV